MDTAQAIEFVLAIEPSLNCSVGAASSDSLRTLRATPHGAALAAVVNEYCSASALMLATLATTCTWVPDGNSMGRPNDCEYVGQCRAGRLKTALMQLTSRMYRTGRVLSRRIARAGASAVLIALVAALETSTLQLRVTPRCAWFAAQVLGEQDDIGACKEILGQGIQCARSLTEEAQRAATVLWYVMPGQGYNLPDWTFDGVISAQRDSTLADLLTQINGELDRDRVSRDMWMAEIGVEGAGTSEALLQRFPSLHMLLVDPYHLNADDPIVGKSKQLTAEGWEFFTSPLGPVQKTQPFRDRATHVIQGSVEAAAWVGRNSLDLVFIDGNHTYVAARDDIAAWWPTVRLGGLMAGHDYTFSYPGVIQAVNEFALDAHLHLSLAPEVWWIRKPTT